MAKATPEREKKYQRLLPGTLDLCLAPLIATCSLPLAQHTRLQQELQSFEAAAAARARESMSQNAGTATPRWAFGGGRPPISHQASS